MHQYFQENSWNKVIGLIIEPSCATNTLGITLVKRNHYSPSITLSDSTRWAKILPMRLEALASTKVWYSGLHRMLLRVRKLLVNSDVWDCAYVLNLKIEVRYHVLKFGDLGMMDRLFMIKDEKGDLAWNWRSTYKYKSVTHNISNKEESLVF